jgi:UDP-GlcNAc:undecaprenyl-phosphate GlcNAc-1-phosphate transferase
MEMYVYVYFGAACLALFATPPVVWLARRIGAVDRPNIRSIHTQPIPRIGGVAIYLSAMGAILALLFLSPAGGDRFREVRFQVFTLLGAASGVFLLGLIDDLRGLPARCKFAAELLGAVVLCLVGVRISSIAGISLGWLGCPLTILWIVGVTNAVNMSDGLDGLAAGVAGIACGVIAVFALYSSTRHTGAAYDNDVMMALFSLALLGSLSGFLSFNFNPAKVFMGDCGSLFLGFTIASMSVMCASKSATLVGLTLPVLALGIPIFDALFAIMRRFLEHRSLFAPDRSHFHHRLLDLGLNQRRVVAIIYVATATAAGLGLLTMTLSNRGILLVFAILLGLIVFLFHLAGAIRLRESLLRLQAQHQRSRRAQQDKHTFENLQLQFRQVRTPDQRWQAVCEAAQRMDFAWVALKTTHPDGRIETEIWRGPAGTPADLSRLLTMTMPFPNGDPTRTHELEVAIHINGSFESASHRGTLFGRLLDESELPVRNTIQQ